MSRNNLVLQAILKIHTVETETAHSYKHTYMCVCVIAELNTTYQDFLF